MKNYGLVIAIIICLIAGGSLVLAENSDPADINIQATVDIPTISSYNPSYGYTYVSSQPVGISGSHFYNGVTANLTNGTYRQKNSTEVLWSGYNSITPSFDLRGLIPGKYWIDVYNPQGYESPKNFTQKWGTLNPLQYPSDVFVDTSGNVFVVDTNYDKIQKFNSAGELISSWGSSGSGDLQFLNPTGICVDNSGSIYVVDGYLNQVQKISSTGVFQAKWGSAGTGSSQFSNPFGICINSTGYIYVTDTGNNRVQIFNSAGAYQYEWGQYGSAAGRLYGPRGISVDSSDNVYVVDTNNHRVQKFSYSGAHLNSWGSQGTGDEQFSYPVGISVDNSGNMYVTDPSNFRIQKITQAGDFSHWGSQGSGNSQYNSPQGICLDNAGNVYVADTANSRIHKTSNEGDFIINIGNPGQYHLKNPYGAATDAAGNIYVADTDNHRIMKYNPSGIYLASWGSYGSGNGQFSSPRGVCVNSTGYILVADTNNNRIQVLNPSGGYFTHWSFNYYPDDLCVNATDSVYAVSQHSNVVYIFNPSGTLVTSWGSYGSGNGQFASPQGICVDKSGIVYVADTGNNRIQRFSADGTIIPPSFGTSGTGDGQFNNPVRVSVDNGGSLYVTDQWNSRIQKFTSTGGFLTLWGSSGSTDGRFTTAAGICTDSSGNLTVVDSGNNRIQKFGVLPFMVSNAPAPSISSITPATGVNSGPVTITDLAGTNFLNGAIVNLTRSGYSNITATGVQVPSGDQITCVLPITGASAGTWSVNVTNPDHQEAFLHSGFEITTPTTTPTSTPTSTPTTTPTSTPTTTPTSTPTTTPTTTPTVTPVYPAPEVISITPSFGQNTSSVSISNLAGSNFRDGAIVNLTRTGYTNITGTGVLVPSGAHITCTLPITGAIAGLWNVEVQNTDGKIGSLPNGFTITAPPAPVITGINPTVAEQNTVIPTFTVTGENFGTNDRIEFIGGGVVFLSQQGMYAGSSLQITDLSTSSLAMRMYDIRVTNLTTGRSGTLYQSFTITGTDNPYYFITATSNEYALIHPSGNVKVQSGDSVQFTLQSRVGTSPTKLSVNGNEVAIPESKTYTFSNVITDHTIDLQATPDVGALVPGFTASPVSGKPLSIQFTDTSTGNPTQWGWNFGDKSISTSQNPVHEYAAPGTYKVSLIVRNSQSLRVKKALLQVYSGSVSMTDIESTESDIAISSDSGTLDIAAMAESLS